jgi:Ca2+-binding RTX toxin-like protein
MIRTKNKWLTSLAVTLGCVIPGALSAGCASEDASSEDISESAATLGVQVDHCSLASASGYNVMNSNLTIAMGTVTSLVLGVVNGYVTVNGYACVKPTAAGGAKLTPAMVKKIAITGTAGADKVVVDTLSGAFGSTILSATGGISIDLAGNAGDTFSIRGSSAADKWSAGVAGTDTYFEISGDTTADVKLSNTEVINISLSGGNDIFNAQGGAFVATHLAAGPVTALTPVTTDLVINAGDGDDTITGGGGDDTISGGAGNDIFKAALFTMTILDDGDDTITGGAGVDKADYSARVGNLTIAMDGTTSSGEGAEADVIAADVEDLVGGTGNDTLTGNAISNHIQGGGGDDLISGGVNAGVCTSDADVLDGEAGNDTFNEGAAADCGDVINGGAGTDIVDYQARTNMMHLTISLDSSNNDGDPTANTTGEKDNVKTDIEVVLGGSGNDTITGSANNDELHGGPGDDTITAGLGNDVLVGDTGNDTLNGEAGDDTFVESGADASYVAVIQSGAGNDTINGGTHDTLGLDTVDYSARVALTPITATLCMDPTKLTGAAGTSVSMVTACTDNDGDPLASEQDKILNVTHLIGGLGDDTLTGYTADDIIEGGAGDDTIRGGLGNDTIFGDAGVDTMFGEAGDDYLDGDDTDGDTDLFDGDNVSNASDADVCITDATEVATNCEL